MTEAMDKIIDLSEEYRRRIQAMHDEKVKNNRHKLAGFGGSYNTDDHGFIYREDFTFAPSYPDGKDFLCGAKSIGENLGRFCREMPPYIFHESALAGAWYGKLETFARVGMPKDVIPEELRKTHESYHMWANGIGGMNHMGPDLAVGLCEGIGGLTRKIKY